LTDPEDIDTRSSFGCPGCERRQIRNRPTSAELGEDVTIGIVALAQSGHFVAVSDQRISFYDQFPPIEKGLNKLRMISADGRWFLAFAAGDIPPAMPLIRRIIGEVNGLKPHGRDISAVMTKCADSYSDTRDEVFADTHLRAINYRTIGEFRREGYKDLGKDEHQRHMIALQKFDLDVQLIIFGYDDQNAARLFEVHNPGRSYDLTWRRYTLVGSGSDLARGSIAQRPLPLEWPDIVYRLLAAKFVAEDASYVGKTTTAFVTSADRGGLHEFSENEIEQIRAEWRRDQERPTPEAALKVIQAHEVLKDILG
jgi:hypothetical protein